MNICPECGTKLTDVSQSQVCPCCGRGNNVQSKHLNIFLILLFIFISSFFIIFFADKAYSAGKIIEYDLPNYSFSYNNSKWYEYKNDEDAKVLKYNSSTKETYLYLNETVLDLKDYSYGVEDLTKLRDYLYTEFVVKGQKKYSNMSSEIKPIGDNYYFTTSYFEKDIEARMYGVITTDNKMTVMYLISDDLTEEQDVLDILKTIKIK